MSFFKSLFGSSDKGTAEEKQKNEERNFDILKYDGIRAHNVYRFDYAIQCFIKALEIHDDAEIYEHLSNCYSRVGRLEKAEQALKDWVKFEPSNPRPLSVLANIAFIQENYQLTMDTCEQALALDSENPLLYYMSGRAYNGLNRNQEAIEQLTKAIEKQVNYTDAYISRANIYFLQDELVKAKEDIEKIQSYDPENEDATLLFGDIEIKEGKIEEAALTYQKILTTNPFNRDAYLRLGMLFQGQKEWDKAILVYNDAKKQKEILKAQKQTWSLSRNSSRPLMWKMQNQQSTFNKNKTYRSDTAFVYQLLINDEITYLTLCTK